MINHWLPVHLGEDFWNVYSARYKERVAAKRKGELLKSKALKQALNARIGKMQQESSLAYDPLNVYKIRINGQDVYKRQQG